MSQVSPGILLTNRNKTEAPPDIRGYLMNWLSVSADNIVILILLIALAVKFIFFEERSEIVRQLRLEEESRAAAAAVAAAAAAHQHQLVHEDEGAEMESKLRQRFASAMALSQSAAATGEMRSSSAVFPLSGMGQDWIQVGAGEADVQLVDKEIQTDEKMLLESSSSSSETLCSRSDFVTRSIEECVAIYRSEVSERCVWCGEISRVRM